jgi:hypothetical protein
MWPGLFRVQAGPLAGFLNLSAVCACLSFVALFHATAVPGTSLERSPRTNRTPLSGPPAPLQLSTHGQSAPLVALSPPISPTPTLTRSSLVPPAAMSSLFTRRSTLPGRPGPRSTGSPVPQASPTSKPYSSCESVHAELSCPTSPVVTLLGFFPSGAFSALASNPMTHPQLSRVTRAPPTPHSAHSLARRLTRSPCSTRTRDPKDLTTLKAR